jgi:hypothetical protein
VIDVGDDDDVAEVGAAHGGTGTGVRGQESGGRHL